MIPFRKSLAFRILFIFFILLCLPVLVDSFLLLSQSFKEGEERAKEILREVASVRQLPLTELLPSNSPIIELLQNDLNLQSDFPKPSTELNETLAKLAVHGDFSAIVLLKYDKDTSKYTILASSLGLEIGIDNTEYIDSIKKNDLEFSLIYLDKENKYHFLNAHNIYSKNNELLGMVLVYRNISQKLNALLAPDITSYPIFFSIILNNSLLFVGSDHKLNMNYFVSLSPEDRKHYSMRLDLARKEGAETNNIASDPIEIKNAQDFPFFTFVWEEKDQLGYISQIAHSHYYLLSYVAKHEISSEVWRDFTYIYSTYALILLIGTLLAFLITKRFTRPLDNLIDTMKHIQKGENVRATIDPLGFEVNTLSTSFNEMIEKVLEKEKIVNAEKLKWELSRKELSLGEEVQQKLFVEKKIIPESVEIETNYLPALEVGGDFCDLFVHNGKLVLMIADAAGKGVEACFYSLIVRTLLRIFSQEITDTAVAVEKANKLFLQDVDESGIFVTVMLAFYHPETRKMNYYNGGHNPGIVRRKNGNIEMLSKHGVALGIDLHPYACHREEITLEPGDQVIFYTDGITEAHNPSKELFSEEALIKIIVDEGNQSAAHLNQKILEGVRRFENGAMQHDDITLMVMKVKDV